MEEKKQEHEKEIEKERVQRMKELEEREE